MMKIFIILMSLIVTTDLSWLADEISDLNPTVLKDEVADQCEDCPDNVDTFAHAIEQIINAVSGGISEGCKLDKVRARKNACLDISDEVTKILRASFSFFPKRAAKDVNATNFSCQMVLHRCPQISKEGKIFTQGISCTNCNFILRYIINEVKQIVNFANEKLSGIICTKIENNANCIKKLENLIHFNEDMLELIGNPNQIENVCNSNY
ncbi:hypothetical protein Mgra_00005858 [Meloidogyne graminicola]|uniref:Saposin B-type domain-containing protein n=1 Tax=Meloidogyne graminicola TaxID=189291 RepID=A0A8S9ZMR9_9BILA|nr:hypothetical protein Mgra_00005858 [Meloidogyne graminicola]